MLSPDPGLAGSSVWSPYLWNKLTLGSFIVFQEEAWQALSLFWGRGSGSDLGLLPFDGDSSAWEEEGW